MPDLNPEQAAAVNHGTGPLRIMAGAGTGKTLSLTQRIVSLIERGLARPQQILALTFTTKAVEELRERIEPAVAAVDPAGGQVDIDTYHAFGGRLVAEHGHHLGLPPEPLVLTPAEGWILLWRSLEEIDFQHMDLTYLRGGPAGSPLNKVIQLSSRLGDELRTIDDLQAWLASAQPSEAAAELADLARALTVYQRNKRELGAIDYGDQIALACELLAVPAVAATVQRRYRFLLVDEFQDTNYAQSVLVQRLVGDGERNVCVVGDPNQAIYAFRGAAPETMDRFADETFPGAATVALRQNYRSTQRILDVANAIWDGDTNEFRGNLVAASGKTGDRPMLVACQHLDDEIAWIAREIERGVASGRSYREMAVIVRKNRHKLAVWQGLRNLHIPAEAVGGTSLFETPEVRELISTLRAIGNQRDDAAFAHLLTGERWGLDERALYALHQERRPDEPLQLAASRLVLQNTAPPEVARCLAELHRLSSRSYLAGLSRLADEIAALRRGAYDRVEEANVRRFLDIVRAFAESRVDRPGLHDLLVYIDLLLAASPEDEAATELSLSEADTVKVLTAHAAKGLEWPVVFVSGANSHDFVVSSRSSDPLPADLARPAPGRPEAAEIDDDDAYADALKSWQKEQHAREELRVLYVALTRAREELTVLWSEESPQRKTKSKLLPRFTPAVEWCEAVEASRAEHRPIPLVTLETFAREAMPALSPLLRGLNDDPGVATTLIDRLNGPWQGVGGRPSIPAAAVERLLATTADLTEQIAVMRQIEQRERDHGETLDEPEKSGALSYTQLETFQRCPHQYYLRYQRGLPGLPARWATARGTAFHAAVALEAERRRAGAPVGWKELEDLYRAQPAVQHAPGGADWNDNTGADPFVTYLTSPDAQAEPLLIEERFTLRLDHQTFLGGVIDRVHRLQDGTVEVVDYKTDGHLRSREEVADGLQLPIYLLAMREVFPQISPPPDQATMFFVRHGERVTVRYTDAELAGFRQRLADLAARMRALTPADHLASTETCGWCSYRLTCEHGVAGGRNR